MFEEYKNITGRTIKQALQSELGGSLLEAMLTVGEKSIMSERLYCSCRKIYKCVLDSYLSGMMSVPVKLSQNTIYCCGFNVKFDNSSKYLI